MKTVLKLKLDDSAADQAHRSVIGAVEELQAQPSFGERVVRDVALPDGTPTKVAHGLGRAPNIVMQGIARGAATAGVINELRPSNVDRAKYIVLEATGFGATITVDVSCR